MKTVILGKEHKALDYFEYGEFGVYNLNIAKNYDKFIDAYKICGKYIEECAEARKEDENAPLNVMGMVKDCIPIMTNIKFDGKSEEKIEDILLCPDDDLASVLGKVAEQIENVVLPRMKELAKTLKENPEIFENIKNDKGMAIHKKEERQEEIKSKAELEKEKLTKEKEELLKRIAELDSKLE